jgi:hypothetical protein
MGTLNDHQNTYLLGLRELIDNKELLTEDAIILVNRFNEMSEANSLTRIQTRGQICVR